MSEDFDLGYWHYEYELKKYFSEITVGQGVDTEGWGFAEYAEHWIEHDIEGYSIFLSYAWNKEFKDGVIAAHKDFKLAILEYVIGGEDKYYGFLRV